MLDKKTLTPSTWVQLENIGSQTLVDDTKDEVVNILTMAFDPPKDLEIDETLLKEILTIEEKGEEVISRGSIKTDLYGNVEYIFTSEDKLKKFTSSLSGGKEVLAVFKKDDKIIILLRTFK